MLSIFRRKKIRGTIAAPVYAGRPLFFHNTLSRKLEEFVPLSQKEVKMYNCGPTVYGLQHIGNMRAAVFGNTIRRALEYWGHSVKQVVNITDVGHLVADADEGQDKMTVGLKQEGLAPTLENMRLLGEKYANAYFSDIAALGVDIEKILFPRASDYIPEQIALIKALQEKGYAYSTKQGIYFDASRFPAYGKLGGIELSGLRAGARVKENPEKRGSHDFTLWKSDKKIGWDSPWGKGFPGWHIECTAMVFKLLGKQIDIHTGGIEHIPIHHNNELAQAESLTGKQFVKYWMHHDHITIEGKKIAKSLGNTIYLSQLIDRGLSARSLRYWFLTAHYRSAMNFTWDAILGANTALSRLNKFFFEDLSAQAGFAVVAPHSGSADPAFMQDFTAAIAHDLDTPKAIAGMWDLLKDDSVSAGAKHASLLEADKILGLGLSERREATRLSVVNQSELPSELQKLLEEREAARADKDFERADELRAQIKELGYEIIDTSSGSRLTKTL